MEVTKKVIGNDILIAEVHKLLLEGRRVTLKVKGVSMLPFIVGDRDSVLLEQAPDYTVGDIVLAEIQPGRYVLHRIFSLDGDRVVLMGDGNCYGTEQCKRSNLLGRAITIFYKGKEVNPYASWPCRKARLWRTLLPVRRYLLAIMRRTGFIPRSAYGNLNNNI
jgi:hypothetical protein